MTVPFPDTPSMRNGSSMPPEITPEHSSLEEWGAQILQSIRHIMKEQNLQAWILTAISIILGWVMGQIELFPHVH